MIVCCRWLFSQTHMDGHLCSDSFCVVFFLQNKHRMNQEIAEFFQAVVSGDVAHVTEMASDNKKLVNQQNPVIRPTHVNYAHECVWQPMPARNRFCISSASFSSCFCLVFFLNSACMNGCAKRARVVIYGGCLMVIAFVMGCFVWFDCMYVPASVGAAHPNTALS